MSDEYRVTSKKYCANSNQYILVEKNTVSVKDIDCEEDESSEKLQNEDDSDSDYIPSDEEDE